MIYQKYGCYKMLDNILIGDDIRDLTIAIENHLVDIDTTENLIKIFKFGKSMIQKEICDDILRCTQHNLYRYMGIALYCGNMTCTKYLINEGRNIMSTLFHISFDYLEMVLPAIKSNNTECIRYVFDSLRAETYLDAYGVGALLNVTLNQIDRDIMNESDDIIDYYLSVGGSFNINNLIEHCKVENFARMCEKMRLRCSDQTLTLMFEKERYDLIEYLRQTNVIDSYELNHLYYALYACVKNKTIVPLRDTFTKFRWFEILVRISTFSMICSFVAINMI